MPPKGSRRNRSQGQDLTGTFQDRVTITKLTDANDKMVQHYYKTLEEHDKVFAAATPALQGLNDRPTLEKNQIFVQGMGLRVKELVELEGMPEDVMRELMEYQAHISSIEKMLEHITMFDRAISGIYNEIGVMCGREGGVTAMHPELSIGLVRLLALCISTGVVSEEQFQRELPGLADLFYTD